MSGDFVLATRGSELARVQTGMVCAGLQRAFPGLALRELVVRTTGDRRPDEPLNELGGAGIFTKELERAVHEGAADAAVHSLKDLPVELPPDFVLGAILARGNSADVLVSAWPGGVEGLPPGARIGTGSPRRQAMMLAVRGDVEVLPVRGNVPTRMEKVTRGGFDAVILAAAGLERLGHTAAGGIEIRGGLLHATVLEDFLPAPGQGAIAVEVQTGNARAREIVAQIHDWASAAEVLAERAVLAALGGGCHMALGARGRWKDGVLHLEAVVFDHPGAAPKHAVLAGDGGDPQSLGHALAAKIHGG